ncbi:hypothetical protein [Streptomyces sp. NPDC017991]|uniref:hypothetical protein n=1 Tax=Streptomyces sp. NPDC017991 TaxID=3365026 RepID=UPI0037A305A9
MAATSEFMPWLRKTDAAQAEGGTDWTAIGSEADFLVLPGSSTPSGPVRGTRGKMINHLSCCGSCR